MEGIIDTHHHIWRLEDLEWLKGPTQPRIFGDYSSIKRDYLINDFITDIENSGVEKSVYIQVNWPPHEELMEAEWVQNVSEENGWPHAFVGYVDFSAEDTNNTLKKLKTFPLMRGIRQQLHWHENPLYRFQSIPDLMNQTAWQSNFAYIQEYGWSFELQVFTSQMKDAALFASDFPETTMVLQHCGMPEDTSDVGMNLWRDGMTRLAECPNVHCKFSGLGTFIHRNDPDFIADITGECLELFSADRCLYGSNFPIERIWTGYGSIVNAFLKAISGLSEPEQISVMRNNAMRIYKMDT